jgi:arylsulfatase A-like enzyme
MKTGTLIRDYAFRVVQSALGAEVATLLLSMLDTAWARGGDESMHRAPALRVLLADIGLVAPVTLAVGIAVGVCAVALSPARAPSPGSMVAWLRARAKGRPADVAAFVPLIVIAAFFWMTLSAQLARALLALDVAAPVAGAAIAAGSLGLGMLLSLGALSVLPALRQALARASEQRPQFVDPAVTGFAALVLAGGLFALGVATGNVSGEGGLFGIYGVLKRPELDLRAAGGLAAVAVAALLAPALSFPRRALSALAFCVLPLLLTGYAATSLNREPAVARALERGAPLGGPSLRLLRRMTDRDKDGASGLFGGGDCKEGDPRVGPLGEEIPDNGVDEDCSGSDLSSQALAALAPTPKTTRTEPTRTVKLPDDMNVVLVTVDTLRADLGFMGYDKPVSPNLDKLAAQSTIFTHAYSLASYTGKSIGPMMIGKYGSETRRDWAHFNRFGEDETFLAQRLSRAGVHTMAVHANRYFGKSGFGLERGFDVVDLSASGGKMSLEVADEVTGDKLTDAALAQLAKPENTSKRFFLWVHYLDPHADYVRHEDTSTFGKGGRALYDGEVAFVDRQIGRLLEAIGKAPWGAKTAIVMTSDHGEAFGEHGMWRHGQDLWEPLVHVPLVMHVPGLAPSRVETRRSLIDLVPTVMDLFRLDPPSPPRDGTADWVDGASLLPDVLLGEGEKPAERDVMIDMPGGPFNDPRRALIHGDMKLIISNNSSYALFDLAKDPDEHEDLWKDEAVRKPMEERYAAVRARLREIRVTGERKTE